MPQLKTVFQPKEPVRLTWWGCATFVIESGTRAIAVDPYLHPTEARFEYVFCTHEHYDHAYPATMELLCRGPQFKKAIISRSCTLPSTYFFARQLTFLAPEEYIIMYPKYYDRSRHREFPGPVELQLGEWQVETIESHEEPSVPIPVEGPIPQLGYLIRDQASGISFLHPGDLHRAYPELAALQGQVDFLFLPLGKLGLQEDEKLLLLVRPRYVIPMHYRYEDDYPIPKLYRDDEPIEQKVLGHHFPSPEDPEVYIASVKAFAEPLGCEVLAIRAGQEYHI